MLFQLASENKHDNHTDWKKVAIELNAKFETTRTGECTVFAETCWALLNICSFSSDI